MKKSKSPGAPFGNQNAKKKATLKIQFRLDDLDLISRIVSESKSKGISESLFVRDFLINFFDS